MDNTTIKKIKIKNISEYLSKIKEIKNKNKDNEFYFRGQSNNLFKNTLPSLFRDQSLFENEDKLFNEFLRNDPELFKDAINNFDRLSLMQHHQLPTRLLDLTTNPLVALYFAVSGNPCNDAEVFIFWDKLVKMHSIKGFSQSKKLLEFLNADSGTNNRWIKDVFSDEMEIESSIVRLEASKKKSVIDAFYTFIEECDKGKKKVDQIIPLIIENKIKSGDIYNAYKKFNRNNNIITLYHEIKKDIGSFEEHIQPYLITMPKIVKPMIQDQRIKNQSGLFMFVPFVNYSDRKAVIQRNICKKIQENICKNTQVNTQVNTQERIDMLKYYENEDNSIKPVEIKLCIESGDKAKILEELKLVGITKNFIYPGHSEIAEEIKDKYSPKK